MSIALELVSAGARGVPGSPGVVRSAVGATPADLALRSEHEILGAWKAIDGTRGALRHLIERTDQPGIYDNAAHVQWQAPQATTHLRLAEAFGARHEFRPVLDAIDEGLALSRSGRHAKAAPVFRQAQEALVEPYLDAAVTARTLSRIESGLPALDPAEARADAVARFAERTRHDEFPPNLA